MNQQRKKKTKKLQNDKNHTQNSQEERSIEVKEPFSQIKKQRIQEQAQAQKRNKCLGTELCYGVQSNMRNIHRDKNDQVPLCKNCQYDAGRCINSGGGGISAKGDLDWQKALRRLQKQCKYSSLETMSMNLLRKYQLFQRSKQLAQKLKVSQQKNYFIIALRLSLLYHHKTIAKEQPPQQVVDEIFDYFQSQLQRCVKNKYRQNQKLINAVLSKSSKDVRVLRRVFESNLQDAGSIFQQAKQLYDFYSDGRYSRTHIKNAQKLTEVIMQTAKQVKQDQNIMYEIQQPSRQKSQQHNRISDENYNKNVSFSEDIVQAVFKEPIINELKYLQYKQQNRLLGQSYPKQSQENINNTLLVLPNSFHLQQFLKIPSNKSSGRPIPLDGFDYYLKLQFKKSSQNGLHKLSQQSQSQIENYSYSNQNLDSNQLSEQNDENISQQMDSQFDQTPSI